MLPVVFIWSANFCQAAFAIFLSKKFLFICSKLVFSTASSFFTSFFFAFNSSIVGILIDVPNPTKGFEAIVVLGSSVGGVETIG
jgi:hypothetical protein